MIILLYLCCIAPCFTEVLTLPTFHKEEILEGAAIQTPLLLFLIDGFRWDYLDRYNLDELPGFQKLLHGGTKAEYLVPDYVSDSYPNYYTLMTGLYSESHGMVHNYMWDPLYPDEEFIIGSNEDQYNPHWWNDAEPFWITAEKQGHSVYMWFWCGCEVEILGYRPSFCMPYQENPNPSPEKLALAIESALNVLANETAKIAAIYYERIDSVGHTFGTDRMDEAIRKLDSELDHMFAIINSLDLNDNINIILVSDHGMSNFSDENRIYMPDIINDTDYERMILGSTSTQIWPNEGELDTLYDKLQSAHPHLQVYKKKDIPEEWHNSEHRRIPPLFLASNIGWIMTDQHGYEYPGRHGYNNSYDDMKGVFFSYGTVFRENWQVAGFRSVDVYQVLCHVTPVECLVNNGTWSNVCDIFSEDTVC